MSALDLGPAAAAFVFQRCRAYAFVYCYPWCHHQHVVELMHLCPRSMSLPSTLLPCPPPTTAAASSAVHPSLSPCPTSAPPGPPATLLAPWAAGRPPPSSSHVPSHLTYPRPPLSISGPKQSLNLIPKSVFSPFVTFLNLFFFFFSGWEKKKEWVILGWNMDDQCMGAPSQSKHLDEIVHGVPYLEWYTIKYTLNHQHFCNGD